MDFDTSQVLVAASSRAKSDVANKLVSMVLHRLSQECPGDLSVRSAKYRAAIRNVFGTACPYCGRKLEPANTVAEHLDAMNRFRAGLHLPGNVLPACKECNLKKRRDDQLEKLVLADSGWASFLAHDGGRCSPSCTTCAYWRSAGISVQALLTHRQRIQQFRTAYLPALAPVISAAAMAMLVEFYSQTQELAASLSSSLVKDVMKKVMREP